MDSLSKKWWFYLILIAVGFVPSVTQKPVDPQQTSLIIQDVLQKPLIYEIPAIFPLVKIALAFFMITAAVYGSGFKKGFHYLVIILLAGIAVFQNISFETRFGYAVVLGNILIQLAVVIFWIYEAGAGKNEYRIESRISWWKIICLILGFFAFWMPAGEGVMGFYPADILMNEAMVTYCMVTPVLLAFLFLFYPKINIPVLRVMSFVGLYYGILNMMTWFWMNTEFWWMGVVHLPLLINSAAGLIVSLRIKKANK